MSASKGSHPIHYPARCAHTPLAVRLAWTPAPPTSRRSTPSRPAPPRAPAGAGHPRQRPPYSPSPTASRRCRAASGRSFPRHPQPRGRQKSRRARRACSGSTCVGSRSFSACVTSSSMYSVSSSDDQPARTRGHLAGPPDRVREVVRGDPADDDVERAVRERQLLGRAHDVRAACPRRRRTSSPRRRARGVGAPRGRRRWPRPAPSPPARPRTRRRPGPGRRPRRAPGCHGNTRTAVPLVHAPMVARAADRDGLVRAGRAFGPPLGRPADCCDGLTCRAARRSS